VTVPAPVLGWRIAGRHLAAALTGEWLEPLPEGLAAEARSCIVALEEILGAGPFMAGDMISLADVALAAIFANLMPMPEADSIIAPSSPLRAWWQRMSLRQSILATAPVTGS
jgi:glutathione S-transferase